MTLTEAAVRVKEASKKSASLESAVKNRALEAVRKKLIGRAADIFAANLDDIAAAEKEGLAAPLLKRLRFDADKLNEVTDGISALMALEDPVGRDLSITELDKGLLLKKTSCPIGVIGMIFESRPDALVQISSLCLKSGNGVILKGGSEALRTNRILFALIAEASVEAGCPAGWIHLAETRKDVEEMLTLDNSIDLLIPRGSNAFVKHIMTHTTIPVLGHADGVTHAYIDSEADIPMAVGITVDSKAQYVAVCNALETLLVHRDIAPRFLPELKKAMDAKKVELRGCGETCRIIDIKPAGEEDWKTEYLDYILSVKIVGTLDEAVEHIHTFGSGHTDIIVTGNAKTAEDFLNRVDSADVFWNCSTRFSDGFKFGLGAEVGIATGKIHSRGPVGMEGLMIYKWKLYGEGQIAADYAEGRKHFTHRRIK
jgi:glutamate-5-semialdehyde dehydrogenase